MVRIFHWLECDGEPGLTALHLNRIVGSLLSPLSSLLSPGISAETEPKLLDIFHLTSSSAAGGEENIYIII